MRYGYYPGCALERNAVAYHQSAMAVARPLGLDFVEVEDWNCCGATEYMSVEALPAYALIGRNLALAARQNTESKQLIAPCSACFLNLSKTNHYMAESPEFARSVNVALEAGGLNYKPRSLRIRHLLDVFVNDVGFDAIAAKVTRPLYGLRAAPYYGCLIVRPGYDAFDDPEFPSSLDHLLRVLGSEVVDFSLKSQCCGGHMTQISETVALELIRRLLKNAADYDADVIVTLCPMCQLNLDAYQEAVNRHFKTDYHIPVLYFTQLIGLAFGLSPAAVGIGKEFVDARPALIKIQTEQPEPVARQHEVGKHALPLPETWKEG